MYKLLELVKKSAGNKVNTQEIIRKLNSKLETIYNSIKIKYLGITLIKEVQDLCVETINII